MILDHVSHSQIEMWLRCPKQWEYRYVYGLKVPPSGALIEGGCYHETLERNFKIKIHTQEDLPLEECLDTFSVVWDARLLEGEYINWEGRNPGNIKDEGIGLVREYISTISPSVQPVKVEEPYVSEVAGVKFVCVIDLEEVSLAVIDHKTSARVYTQADVDKNLQATAAAFVLGRGIVFYNHIALKTRVPQIQVVKTYRTRADIEWWATMAAQIVQQMKAGMAPPRSVDAFGKDGWWCSERFCGFYERCRGECMRSYF